MQNTPISTDDNNMEPDLRQEEYLIPITPLLHLFSDNAILTNPSTNDNIIDASNDIDAIRTWLHEYRDSHNTFIAYRQCIERYFIWISQYNKKLSEVKREDVQNYQDFLANPQPAATWCGPKAPRSSNNWRPFVTGLSVSSINHQILIIKNLYNYLQNAGYLERNPFALMKAKRKQEKPDIENVLEKNAINYVLEYIQQLPASNHSQEFDKEQAQWLINLFFLTGMRISEVSHSRMNHFVYKRDRWWLKVVGKGEKHAEIVVTQELMQALIQYRQFIGIDDYPATNEDYPTVFAKRGDTKNGLTANMLHRIIKKRFQNAAVYAQEFDLSSSYALASASAHWLRHASATAQLNSGVSLESVKDNLRHESVETTMKYVHKNKDDRHDETSNKFKL